MFQTAINKFLHEKNYPALTPKAVFFDMDGVLYDSVGNHAKAWTAAMRDAGLHFTEYDCYLNEGRTGHSTIDLQFQKELGRDATEAEKQRIYDLKANYFDTLGGGVIMPFANELLQKIKAENFQIFLVTGSGQPSLLDNLSHDFPNIFVKKTMVTAFDVKFGKPDPEPYLIALQKSGVQSYEAVVVENAPLGVQAGSGAGLFSIAVNTGPLENELLFSHGANVVLSGVQELFEKWDTFIAATKS